MHQRLLNAFSLSLLAGLTALGCSSDSGGDVPLVGGPPPGGPPPGGPGPGGPGGPPTPADATVVAALQGAGIVTPTPTADESSAMIELGRNLFFDKILSGNRNISCATCHHPTAGTADALPLPIGEGGTGVGAARTGTTDQVIPRNAPALFGLGAQGVDSMFWDSRVHRDPTTGDLTTPEPALNGATPARADMAAQLTTALAAQAMFPPTSASEMRGDPGDNELADAATNIEVWELIMARLVGTSDGTVGGIAAYRTLFSDAFPGVTNYDDLTFAHAARAIAAFESSVYGQLFNAPLDRYLAGDTTAISDAAKRGAVLFTGQARCDRCHSGPLLSDFEHHGVGTPQLGADDLGLSQVTSNPNDDYEFRTPPLRNVTQTAPYFHAGAFADLGSVVRHYRNPGNSLLNYDPADHLPAFYQPLVDTDVTRNQARIAAVSGIIGGGIPMNNGQINDLVAFLQALEDPAALELAPTSVPSGLTVD